MTEDLTPEINLSGEELFLVRINGEESVLVDNEKDAILAVDSLAANEISVYHEKFPGEYNFFREDHKEGRRVELFSQKVGSLWNGSIVTHATFDFVNVPCAVLKKGRLTKEIPEEKKVCLQKSTPKKSTETVKNPEIDQTKKEAGVKKTTPKEKANSVASKK